MAVSMIETSLIIFIKNTFGNKIIANWINMDEFFRIKKIIEEIASLENNYDGYGSKKPKISSINYAIRLVNKLIEMDRQLPDEIYPNPNGHIILKWRNKDFRLLIQVRAKTLFALLEENGETIYYQIPNIEGIRHCKLD
jgi:hypothetical protein